jgi:RNA polymerase sigma factor (sigma-70 family)
LESSNFRELPEHELATRSDEELIDYIRAARAAGKDDAVRLALAILVYGYLPIIQRRVAAKVPESDVQDVAGDAMESAIKSTFDGESVGSFASWLHRITLRRIVDYYRRKEGKPETEVLLTGDENDEKLWGEVPAVQFEGVTLDVDRALKIAFDELSEAHQRVVELYVFWDLSAAEVAEETGESEANVHQIGSRFRKRLRDLLEDDDTSS